MNARLCAAACALVLLLCGRAARAAEGDAERARPLLAGKIEGGATYREIFKLPVLGPEVALGFGVPPRDPTAKTPQAFFLARYSFGRTEEGLAVHVARLGAQLDVAMGRVRPSLGAEVMWLAFDRVSTSGLIQHWGIGLHLGASVDVIRISDRQAFYVGARLALDVFPHKLIPRTLSPGGSLAVGFRF